MEGLEEELDTIEVISNFEELVSLFRRLKYLGDLISSE